MNKIKIHYIDLSKLDLEIINHLPLLSKEDYNDNYEHEVDHNAHLISLYLKKKYMPNYTITKFGKPVSDNIKANISHTANMVIIGLSEKYDIGVDIELKDLDDKELINFTLNDEEKEHYKANKSFIELWTAKESLLKCMGMLLPLEPKNLQALPVDGTFNFMDSTYTRHKIKFNDYTISVTLKTDEDFECELIEEKL